MLQLIEKASALNIWDPHKSVVKNISFSSLLSFPVAGYSLGCWQRSLPLLLMLAVSCKGRHNSAAWHGPHLPSTGRHQAWHNSWRCGGAAAAARSARRQQCHACVQCKVACRPTCRQMVASGSGPPDDAVPMRAWQHGSTPSVGEEGIEKWDCEKSLDVPIFLQREERF